MGENRGQDGDDQRGYERDNAADEDDDEPGQPGQTSSGESGRVYSGFFADYFGEGETLLVSTHWVWTCLLYTSPSPRD